jgi:arylsulfatase A-like enzyme
VAQQKQMGIERYGRVLDDARKAVASPDVGLAFVHLPVPHGPNIYDRSLDQFTSNGASSYLDNLELADRAVGELRSAIERAGLWEHTALLISSDHCYRSVMWQPWKTNRDAAAIGRTMDHRVPFLVKLPGQTVSVAYDRAFNTVLSRDLALALLHGQIADPGGLVRWLDEHGSTERGSYTLRDDAAG